MKEITLVGHVAPKKNQLTLRMTRQGPRACYKPGVRESLDDLNAQVAEQWQNGAGAAAPLVHPALAVVFYVLKSGTRSDRDNKLATVMDALVAGGVLKDDSIKYCNAPLLMGEAIICDDVEGARVFIEETGSLDRLYRKFRRLDLNDFGQLKAQVVRRIFARG